VLLAAQYWLDRLGHSTLLSDAGATSDLEESRACSQQHILLSRPLHAQHAGPTRLLVVGVARSFDDHAVAVHGLQEAELREFVLAEVEAGCLSLHQAVADYYFPGLDVLD
jgi:hypothetical protein